LTPQFSPSLILFRFCGIAVFMVVQPEIEPVDIPSLRYGAVERLFENVNAVQKHHHVHRLPQSLHHGEPFLLDKDVERVGGYNADGYLARHLLDLKTRGFPTPGRHPLARGGRAHDLLHFVAGIAAIGHRTSVLYIDRLRSACYRFPGSQNYGREYCQVVEPPGYGRLLDGRISEVWQAGKAFGLALDLASISESYHHLLFQHLVRQVPSQDASEGVR